MNHLLPFVPENWAQNIAANLHTKTDIQSSVKLEDLARWTGKWNYLLVSKCKLCTRYFQVSTHKTIHPFKKETKPNPPQQKSLKKTTPQISTVASFFKTF